ncbi:MAG: hypothetical protein Q9174_006240 [Haloplaca sp. 1 TL-2023]
MPKKVKSRTIAVRLISMALTGYYRTFRRPRVHRPLSKMGYDPVADTGCGRCAWGGGKRWAEWSAACKEEDGALKEVEISRRSSQKSRHHAPPSHRPLENTKSTQIGHANYVLPPIVRKQVLFLEQKRGGGGK